MRRIILLFLLFILPFSAKAETPPWTTQNAQGQTEVHLTLFWSLTCPHCAKLATDSNAALKDTYVASGKVSFEYRSFAIHGIDIPLTVLAKCAAPEAFFGLVVQVYVNQNALLERAQKGQAAAQAAAALPPAKRMGAIADAYGLTEFFSARGVPVAKAHTCLADTAAAEAVAKLAEDAGKQGIESTPPQLINDSKVAGAPGPEVETALKAAGAR